MRRVWPLLAGGTRAVTVRARQPGIATGLPLGRMQPDTRAAAAPPPSQACPRCGCNLSRYRDAWETHCAPCTRVLVTEGQLTLPAFEPEWTSGAEQARAAVTEPRHGHCTDCGTQLTAPSRNTTGLCKRCYTWHLANGPRTRCACGNRKDVDANQCAVCAGRARRRPGTPASKICACGRPKNKGARRCVQCREEWAA